VLNLFSAGALPGTLLGSLNYNALQTLQSAGEGMSRPLCSLCLAFLLPPNIDEDRF